MTKKTVTREEWEQAHLSLQTEARVTAETESLAAKTWTQAEVDQAHTALLNEPAPSDVRYAAEGISFKSKSRADEAATVTSGEVHFGV